jgi:hypothetical protein
MHMHTALCVQLYWLQVHRPPGQLSVVYEYTGMSILAVFIIAVQHSLLVFPQGTPCKYTPTLFVTTPTLHENEMIITCVVVLGSR